MTNEQAATRLQNALNKIAKIDVDSGGYETPEMIQAGIKYVRAANSFLKAIGATGIVARKNHFERTINFSIGEQRWTWFSADFRNWCNSVGDSPMLGPYFRTVKDDKDFHGGHNQMPSLDRFAETLMKIVTRQVPSIP